MVGWKIGFIFSHLLKVCWTRSRDSSNNWFSIIVHLLLFGRPIHEFIKKFINK
jgi:hypothetical protein